MTCRIRCSSLRLLRRVGLGEYFRVDLWTVPSRSHYKQQLATENRLIDNQYIRDRRRYKYTLKSMKSRGADNLTAEFSGHPVRWVEAGRWLWLRALVSPHTQSPAWARTFGRRHPRMPGIIGLTYTHTHYIYTSTRILLWQNPLIAGPESRRLRLTKRNMVFFIIIIYLYI